MAIDLKNAVKDKVFLVTGGTGSFGNAVVDRLLSYGPKEIIILSRDEKKQFDMKNKYNSDVLKFVIGDVRDREKVRHATQGVNYIFHAAALKQVPNCEFFPMEAIKTNVIGAHNVIYSAIDNGVDRVVVLSTDKAVHPINVMGMTKALMERTMIAAAREGRGKTTLCGTRYGNVMYTRGSVIPFFVDLMRAGKSLKITNGQMTRFMMSLEESVDLVLHALFEGKNGTMYVKKSPATTIETLARAVAELFEYGGGIEEIGIRPGEKMHEILVSEEELFRARDQENYYEIQPESPTVDWRDYYYRGKIANSIPKEGYTSQNTNQLSIEETKALLLTLPEIKKELGHLNKK